MSAKSSATQGGYKRGQAYWVNLDPTVGSEINKKRPCVIVGINPINAARRTVLVVPLSSSATPRPPMVIAMSSLGEDSVAVCDQLRAIDKTRLTRFITSASIKDMHDLDEGLRVVLGL